MDFAVAEGQRPLQDRDAAPHGGFPRRLLAVGQRSDEQLAVVVSLELSGGVCR